MSFLPKIFSGSNSITKEDVDVYIKNISENIDVQSNILEILEASHQYSHYICQNALPSLFNILIQSKLDDDIIADIFQIINNSITDSEYSSANALLIIDYDLAIPIIIDCINTDKVKKKIAVIQIITKIGILQPSQLQQCLTADQDRLVQFLTLINDPHQDVIHAFLSLIPILVVNNSDFQQLFAFNIMEKLMKLIESKVPLSIPALRSILTANSNTQNLFFGTIENLSIMSLLLDEDDQETILFFIDLFRGKNSANYRHYLKESNLINIILRKALTGHDQFIQLLGLSIKNEPEFCKMICEDKNLQTFLLMYLQTDNEVIESCYLQFFKSFLYQSDESSKSLSELIVSIEDRNDPKLIELATYSIMSSQESKIFYLSNSPNFTSSMIGFFISHINFEPVLHFLIALCWESRSACLEFKNEQCNPISFLKQFLPDESPLIQAQCTLLLRIIHFVLDQDDEENNNLKEDDIDQLEIQIRDVSTYLSTLETNDYFTFLREIIAIILNDQAVPDNNSEEKIEQEDLIEEEEEDHSEHNNTPLPIENKEEEITDEKEQLETSNYRLTDSDVIQRQFDEFREQQNETISQLNKKNQEEKEMIERNHRIEIESLQSQLTNLQSTLDTITASSEREIAELKQKIVSTEIECTQKLSQMKNINRDSFTAQTDKLREQCDILKRDLDILKSQHKALFSQQIEEFRDEQNEFQKIVDENKSLKFRISQLLKDNEHFKEENKELKTNQITERIISNDGNNDQYIISLKAQINDLQSQTHSLLQKDAENQRTINELQQQKSNFEEIENNWQRYTDQLNTLKSENDSLKNELSQSQKTIKDHKNKIDDITSRYSEAQKVISSVQALVDQNTKLQNDISQLNEQNVQLELNLNILKSQSSNQQLVELMNQNSSLKKAAFETDQLKAQNHELSQTVEALKSDNSNFRGQILDLERQLTRHETENTFLRENATSLTNGNDNSILQSFIAEFKNQLSEMRDSNNSKLEKENTELKQQVLQTTMKLNTLQNENSILRRNIEFSCGDSLDLNEIDPCNKNSTDVVSQLDAKNLEILALQSELSSLEEIHRDQFKKDNDARNQEMATIRTFLQSNTAKCKLLSEMKNSIDNNLAQITKLAQKFTQITKSGIQNISSEQPLGLIEQLRFDNEILRAKNADLNKRITQLTEDNTRLAKHASQVTNKFKRISKENSFLRSSSSLLADENGDYHSQSVFNLNNDEEVRSLQSQLLQSNTESKKQEKYIHSLLEQNKSLVQQVAHFNSSQITDNELRKRCKQLENEKFAALKQKAATVQQLRIAMKDLRTLQENYLKLQDENAKLKKNLQINNELTQLPLPVSKSADFEMLESSQFDFDLPTSFDKPLNDSNIEELNSSQIEVPELNDISINFLKDPLFQYTPNEILDGKAIELMNDSDVKNRSLIDDSAFFENPNSVFPFHLDNQKKFDLPSDPNQDDIFNLSFSNSNLEDNQLNASSSNFPGNENDSKKSLRVIGQLWLENQRNIKD